MPAKIRVDSPPLFFEENITCRLEPSSPLRPFPIDCCRRQRTQSGDLPPRSECAELWHERLLAELTSVKLTLLVGQYAQKRYLGGRLKSNLTETVRAWEEYWPTFLPLPHPSPRNNIWLSNNPWFEDDVLPRLRSRVKRLV